MFHIPDGKFNYFQGSTMTNALLSGFIDLLKTASHVQLMLPGLTTLSTAEIEETDSSITQVRLLWGQNCETLLSPAVIAAGQWDGDTFNCSDNYGRPVKLQMLAMTTLKPAAATSSELDRLLRDVLVEGLSRQKSEGTPMRNALQVAVWEGASSVRRLLFPQMLETLSHLQDVILNAIIQGGWDWDLMPQLRNQVTAALAADYGTEVTWSPDNLYDNLDSGEILDYFSDLRKRTDNLDDESELVWRVLVLAVNLLEKKQLHELLQGLRRRLENTNDDMRELCPLPIDDLLRLIADPEAAAKGA